MLPGRRTVVLHSPQARTVRRGRKAAPSHRVWRVHQTLRIAALIGDLLVATRVHPDHRTVLTGGKFFSCKVPRPHAIGTGPSRQIP